MQQTVDADVNLPEADLEVIPVCGLFFFSAAAADVAAMDADALEDAETAVCGSSFFSAAAADSETAAADADVMTTCAAK